MKLGKQWAENRNIYKGISISSSMKIKINENESYEIICPENIDSQDFFAFKSRIDIISKIIGKDPFFNGDAKPILKPTFKIKRGIKNEERPWFQDRDVAIKLVEAHYAKDKSHKNEIMKKHGLSTASYQDHVLKLKPKWDIKPYEVNLESFPNIKKQARVNYEDRPWFQDRKEAVKLMRVYYGKDKNHKEAIMEEHNLSIAGFQNHVLLLKKTWDIKPYEVNLESFPSSSTDIKYLHNYDETTTTNINEEKEI